MGLLFKISTVKYHSFTACLSAGVSIENHRLYFGDVFLSLKLAKLLK